MTIDLEKQQFIQGNYNNRLFKKSGYTATTRLSHLPVEVFSKHPTVEFREYFSRLTVLS